MAPSGTQNCWGFCLFVCLLVVFCYMVQGGLKLSILLSHFSERWCGRCAAPCPAPSVIPFLGGLLCFVCFEGGVHANSGHEGQRTSFRSQHSLSSRWVLESNPNLLAWRQSPVPHPVCLSLFFCFAFGLLLLFICLLLVWGFCLDILQTLLIYRLYLRSCYFFGDYSISGITVIKPLYLLFFTAIFILLF